MWTVGRDTIVVAASAGGVEALRTLVGSLPADLPATVLVVLHLPPQGGGVLAGILDRAGPLKAVPAEDMQELRRGRVYVARPDHHLLVHEGKVRLSRGPRHNGHRPAADPLFMSAALDAGERVAAVVLSGMLDDGVRGCVAVDRRGGAVAVQDPGEAAFPGMPEAAVAAVPNAPSLPVRELADWLVRQSRTPVITEARMDDTEMMREVGRFLSEEPALAEPGGTLSGLGCPECGGPMYEQRDEGLARLVCRVGHAWSDESLVGAQSDAVERALWIAIQRLDERVRILGRMARSAEERGGKHSHGFIRKEAARTREAVETIRMVQARISGGDDSLLLS
ncbi:chemotaxis protein CheB [Nonomuraea sp. C10]|uniref:chemotaxis protein CheB n=1 Tax=Nonomuraea sp. C10 TaxID=2600577 RepID=UPI001650ADDC|nr:chemotaxis protein CheB [Nonomuraea sp. C10]